MTCDEARALAERLAPELGGRLEVIRHREDWPAPPENCEAYTLPPNMIVCIAELMPELTIHETSHLLPREPLSVDATDSELAELRRRQLTYLCGVTADAGRRAPWDCGHGLEFIRRCVHLWARAESQGLALRQVNIRACSWSAFGIEEYRSRLGWEPMRFARASFGEIESTEPPACFSALFERDMAAWLRHNLEERSA